jgi:hypothetical protein
MNTIKFKNADKLVEYCIKNNILAGQVWVETNALGEGTRTILWFHINCVGEINTYILNQSNINDFDYAYMSDWHSEYKGSFELVLPFDQFTKPEVYKVGDTVEVLENAREIGNWKNLSHAEKRSPMIGNTYKIISVDDTVYGVYYTFKYDNNYNFTFAHYCVRKVEKPPKEMTLQEIEQELGYKIIIK